MENLNFDWVSYVSVLALLFKTILGITSFIVLIKLSKAIDKYLKDK